jgi:hypothetical protein
MQQLKEAARISFPALPERRLFMHGISAKRAAAAACTACIICAVSTGAFFPDHDDAVNALTPGFVETHITEEFPDPDPVPYHGLTTIPKKVVITNPLVSEAACECFVRVRISISDSEIGNSVTLHFPDSASWIRKSDGFYYYTKRLSPGESTSPLIDSVTIDADTIPAEARQHLDHFDINVYEESVQAADFDQFETAWQAFGI